MNAGDWLEVILMAVVYVATARLLYLSLMENRGDRAVAWASAVISALWPIVIPLCVSAVVFRRVNAWVVGDKKRIR